jgi:hypothetical protein
MSLDFTGDDGPTVIQENKHCGRSTARMGIRGNYAGHSGKTVDSWAKFGYADAIVKLVPVESNQGTAVVCLNKYFGDIIHSIKFSEDITNVKFVGGQDLEICVADTVPANARWYPATGIGIPIGRCGYFALKFDYVKLPVMTVTEIFVGGGSEGVDLITCDGVDEKTGKHQLSAKRLSNTCDTRYLLSGLALTFNFIDYRNGLFYKARILFGMINLCDRFNISNGISSGISGEDKCEDSLFPIHDIGDMVGDPHMFYEYDPIYLQQKAGTYGANH